ncbi:MAG: glucosidase [Acidobacteria bacterium 13_1_20CM_3_53_8]|nr:MAG: glucosidase [Acidobacteria bacterium 13_1_20CM_3_53_8]
MTEEERRLTEARDRVRKWKMWGPYLSERAWGTVREDYSPHGTAWDYFTHDHARSRAYRWNEEGLAGICDESQALCFSIALWNGADPILKERAFGLTNSQGNHGEDVKEYYYYLDNTPTHSYMKCLYKYPQRAYPYSQLIEENARRGREGSEYELIDTGVFDDDSYFDVRVEYAKAAPEDILILLTVTNHGQEEARLDLIPTLWFRNTWSWGRDDRRPIISASSQEMIATAETSHEAVIHAEHHRLGNYYLVCQRVAGAQPELLFTENETNAARLYGAPNSSPFVKDGINDYIVQGQTDKVNPSNEGTKACALYRLTIGAGETEEIRLRLSTLQPQSEALGAPFDNTFVARKREADQFYSTVAPEGLSDDARNVQRQALAGLLWSKQYYNYDVEMWLNGDPVQPAPPPERWEGRNHDWRHLNNSEIVSMPDKWEYPWYAAWDLAFHCISLSLVDPDFAKDQLILLLREWYMHPNGQLPAYEWAFGDVNPPVHAWAALRVYGIERRLRGAGDTKFLERVFHKLLINFTWWINRKDVQGRNIFQGGFLGLDNIGVFDRSAGLPGGGYLDQSDGTSWMAMYCLNMLSIALELARHDDTYEDVATKFLEHFFYIAHAMNDRPAVRGDDGIDLWDEDEGFYYDVLHLPDKSHQFVRVRSLVGLIPLLAVETIDSELLDMLPDFRHRLEWFLSHRQDLSKDMASVTRAGEQDRRRFAVVNTDRLRSLLSKMLDENEFLSPYGIRSISRYHLEHPYRLTVDGTSYEVSYQPAESRSGLFGGNSNWRGPIWFPLNYLLIEALQKFDYFYGESFTVECPVGSGRMLTLWQVATELSQRLISIFTRDESGRRPVFGGNEKFQSDPNFRDLIPFHEYFHGDDGAGLGASHQTGWTALVAKLIQQSGI